MMDRLLRLVAVLAAALVIGAGAAIPAIAQEAGDQIVETEVTPPADDSATDETQDEMPVSTDESETGDDANSTEPDPAAEAAEDDPSTSTQRTAETRAATESASDAGASEPDDAAGAELIVVEDLNLREEAELSADVIQVMPAGSTVTLAGDGEAVNDFLPVNFGDDAGWAFLPFLVDESLGDNLAVVTTDLNLRSGPSVEDDVITVMPEGAQVRVAGFATDDDGDDWNRVYYDETLAWASAEYVEYTDDPVDSGATVDETGGAVPVPDAGTTAPVATGDLVTVVDANLRAGSSLDEAVVTVVPFGTFASVTGEAANGFVPVTVGGVAGWLSTEVIAPAEIAASLTATDTPPAAVADTSVASGNPDDDEPRTALADVNLHVAPSEDAEILLVIAAGETLTLTFDGYENGYAAVSYQGTVGWVFADLLTP